MRPRAPLYPGHEVVGVVAEVGTGPTELAPGARVFVHHHVPCMVCRACRRGATTSCRRFRETRLHPGGLAVYLHNPAGNAFTFDTSGPAGGRFAKEARRARVERDALFRRLDMDSVAVRTDRPYIGPLISFFRARERRLRR